MGIHADNFGKFVRLNLIGEIVEVLDYDSTEITVNYKGRKLTFDHHEVSRITPEEEAVATRRV
jgi:preprotein translocase subunit YajC